VTVSLINGRGFFGLSVELEGFSPMLALLVSALTDNDKIGLKSRKKCGGPEHFGRGENEASQVTARSRPRINMAGHFTFDQRDSQEGNRKRFRFTGFLRRGVHLNPLQRFSWQQRQSGLQAARYRFVHDELIQAEERFNSRGRLSE
jgi:hypothetical protein